MHIAWSQMKSPVRFFEEKSLRKKFFFSPTYAIWAWKKLSVMERGEEWRIRKMHYGTCNIAAWIKTALGAVVALGARWRCTVTCTASSSQLIWENLRTFVFNTTSNAQAYIWIHILRQMDYLCPHRQIFLSIRLNFYMLCILKKKIFVDIFSDIALKVRLPRYRLGGFCYFFRRKPQSSIFFLFVDRGKVRKLQFAVKRKHTRKLLDVCVKIDGDSYLCQP